MAGRPDSGQYMGWRQPADTSAKVRSGARLQADGSTLVGHMSPVVVAAAGSDPGALVAVAAAAVDVVVDMRY